MAKYGSEGLREPDEEMLPEEKGALLLQYVKAEQPVATLKVPPPGQGWQDKWKRLEFDATYLKDANLNGAHLEGANLSGAHLEFAWLDSAHLGDANLSGAHLEGAYLDGAHLEGANLTRAQLRAACLSWAHLERANLMEARMEGTNLRKAYLEGANLRKAYLEGVNLSGAHLEGANLRGSAGAPRDRRGARISADTYLKSYWNPITLLEWLRAGAILADFENLPVEVQEVLNQTQEGLTLYFNTQLMKVDVWLVDSLTSILKGIDSDAQVTGSDFTAAPAWIRIKASTPAALERIADGWYRWIWNDQAEMQARYDAQEAAFLEQEAALRQQLLQLEADRQPDKENLQTALQVAHTLSTELAEVRQQLNQAQLARKEFEAMWGIVQGNRTRLDDLRESSPRMEQIEGIDRKVTELSKQLTDSTSAIRTDITDSSTTTQTLLAGNLILIEQHFKQLHGALDIQREDDHLRIPLTAVQVQQAAGAEFKKLVEELHEEGVLVSAEKQHLILRILGRLWAPATMSIASELGVSAAVASKLKALALLFGLL